MAGIHARLFGGVIPRLGNQLLPDHAAQLAENCDLYSGELRSFRSPKLTFSSAKTAPKSAYRMYSGSTDYWLTWVDDVDAIRPPVVDSAFRLFYTGDVSAQTTGPKKTNLALATGAGNYPADYLEMGIPRPTVAPTISTSGGAGTNVTVSYVYTLYSSTWDEEGPPSASAEATYRVDGTWSVVSGTAVPGTSTHYAIDKKRIYRTIASASGVVNLFRVAEIGLGTGTYDDIRTNNTDTVISKNPIIETVELTTSGVVVSGSEWDPPPSDLTALTAGANGMAAGISGKNVCFAEPFNWHAWPTRYQYAVPWDPVRIDAVGNMFIVATKGKPVIFTGSHPGSMQQSPVDRDDMPCVAKRSGCPGYGGALFAGAHGLAWVGPGGSHYVTTQWMTEKEWNDLIFPSTLIGRMFNDRYFGMFDTGSGKRGIVIDPSAKSEPFFLNKSVTGLYTDPVNGKLYLLIDNGVWEWEGDPNNQENRQWKSKVFVLPRPINLGAYQVDADYAALFGDAAAEDAAEAEQAASNAALLASLTDNYANQTAGKIKGDIGSHCLGGYTPDQDGPVGSNNYGIMLGGSLLLGGASYSIYASRSLSFEVRAFDYEDYEMKTVFSDTLVSGKPARMYDSGYLSDQFEFIVSGNINVRRIALGETMGDLRQV